MILTYFILIPFIGGLLSWTIGIITKNTKIIKYISLITIIITFLLSLIVLIYNNKEKYETNKFPNWKIEYIQPWIPKFGINIHLAMDNISNIMIILSTFMGIISILCSWSKIDKQIGAFYFNLLWSISNTIGIFLSIDMLLLFIFWEITIFPIYFLIILWGNPTNTIIQRIHAAKKFLIYSQISGITMLVSILSLVIIYHNNEKIWTFNYEELLKIQNSKILDYIIMLGFFISFTIKIPIIPFHNWLIHVHKTSPIYNTIELTSLLLKTGIYGLFRFNLIFFPKISYNFSYFAMLIGIISILYGSWMAFSQTNIKKLIAYSNISHSGYIIVALYSENQLAYQGAIIYIIANTISSSGLFIMSEQLYNRLHTHDIRNMGGIWEKLNFLPGMSIFLFSATLGIPGTGNFIGEIAILFGVFQTTPIVSIILAYGLIFSTIYSIITIQKIFFGKNIKIKKPLKKITKKEKIIIYTIGISSIFIGIFPKFITNITFNNIKNINYYVIKNKI
ncbi:MAG: NADH:quinone oxidoreductase subunit M [Candidatus Westeberhardia cardiocondylae]|nr:NADH:quinone oxidoreductase subunit M [Candidatus Westeberhardia cardiocondylae]